MRRPVTDQSFRPAAAITGMLPSGAVDDCGPAVAVVAATAQLRVERVEHLGVDRADRPVTDQRRDVPVEVAAQCFQRAQLDSADFQVPLD